MGRKKAYDRDKVLEKAMKLFWRKGFEGTHLQELVDTTGLNRFSLYKEFQGKEGLFEEAMGLYLIKLETQISPLLREPKGLDNVKGYFEELDFKFFNFGCFMTNTLSEKNTAPKKAYDNLLTFGVRFETLMIENLEAAKKNEELKKGVDIESLAKFLTSLDLGMMVYSINAPAEDKDIVAKLAVDMIDAYAAN